MPDYPHSSQENANGRWERDMVIDAPGAVRLVKAKAARLLVKYDTQTSNCLSYSDIEMKQI